MAFNEITLSYILHSLPGDKSDIQTPQKPLAFSWDYERDVHNFKEEKKQFDLAKKTYDYNKKLEFLERWRDRYNQNDTPTGQRLLKNLDILIKNTKKDIQKREDFYQLIAHFHIAHQNKDIKQEIDALQEIYKKADTFIYRDAYRRKKWLLDHRQNLPFSSYPIKGGTARMRAELSLHIARRLSKLYKENFELASQYKENPYEWQQHSKDWEDEASRQYQNSCRAIEHSSNPNANDYKPFGQDAFESGGLYGPEVFSKRIEKILSESLAEKNEDETESPKPENGTYNGMPSLFSQEMLNEMIDKHFRD